MSLSELPSDLPAPEDDGAGSHLAGTELPAVSLPATNGDVELYKLQRLHILYVYQLTGRSDTSLPEGWNEIRGARGCIPQSCAFRDHLVTTLLSGISAGQECQADPGLAGVP